MGVDRELDTGPEGEAKIGHLAGRGRGGAACQVRIGREHAPVGAGQAEGRVDQVVVEGVAESGTGAAEQVRLLADHGEGRIDVLVAEALLVGACAALEIGPGDVGLQAVDEGAGLPIPAGEGAADHRGCLPAEVAAAGGVSGPDGRNPAGADRGRAEIVIAERGARPIDEGGLEAARRIGGDCGSRAEAHHRREARPRDPSPPDFHLPSDPHSASPLPSRPCGLADAVAAATRPGRHKTQRLGNGGRDATEGRAELSDRTMTAAGLNKRPEPAESVALPSCRREAEHYFGCASTPIRLGTDFRARTATARPFCVPPAVHSAGAGAALAGLAAAFAGLAGASTGAAAAC